MPTYLVAIFLSILVAPSVCWATRIEEALSWSSVKELHKQDQWLRLIHYKSTLFGLRSDVRSKDYFLSSEGHKNPREELRATIEAMFAVASGDPDHHAQCRFRSRFVWLKSQLPAALFAVEVQPCAAFQEWTMGETVESVSLIFASGFLGNPASFFGHPFLKLNFAKTKTETDLMHVSVNHGAFTPPNENVLVYALKGLLGGYDAGFAKGEFYQQNFTYNEIELRDLWDYQLRLTSFEKDLLVAHVWEMLGKKVPYYFLWDNCASRMAELIEVVTSKQTLPGLVPYAIPLTIFNGLISEGMVTKIELKESRQSKFIQKFEQLSASLRDVVRLSVKQTNNYLAANFRNLSEENKKKVLETLADYYSYLGAISNSLEIQSAKKAVFLEQLKLTSVPVKWEVPAKIPPNESQKSVLTFFGYTYSEASKSMAAVRIRPAYYDLISPEAARPRNSALATFDASFDVEEDRIRLKLIDLISVQNLNISHSGLPGDGGFAWRFKLGFEALDHACEACTVARVEAGGGKAWSLTNKVIIYGMLDPRLQSAVNGSGHASVSVSVATLIRFYDWWSGNFSAGLRKTIDVASDDHSLVSVENRFGKERSWDIRVNYYQHVDERFTVGYARYW